MVCPFCQVVLEAGAGSLLSHILAGTPDESADRSKEPKWA